jgi:LysR family transcriptional regulator of gallate degradation
VNDINLRHIKAFMAVAQTGRVSHGAAHILRAQSAVTRSVLELESSLGVRLFERSPAGMALTVFGEALLARGRRSADQFALAAQEMSDMLGRSISPGAPLFSMQVSVKRLEALVVLTELHNMPAAARRVGVTQPAISAAIREIEDSLGTA